MLATNRVIKKLICLIFLTASLSVAAEDGSATNFQILKDKVEADKKLVIASNVQLTEAEAKAFWPIYDEYQTELEALQKQLAGIIVEYADAYNAGAVDNEKAQSLLKQYLDAEMADIKLKQTYANKLYKVIPAAKAVRYIQIENKIKAVQAFMLADAIPLVD